MIKQFFTLVMCMSLVACGTTRSLKTDSEQIIKNNTSTIAKDNKKIKADGAIDADAKIQKVLSNYFINVNQTLPILQKQAKFSLFLDSVPISEVYQILAEDSDYNIVPPQTSDKISVSLKNVTLFEALNIIRDTNGYDYLVSGNNIYINNKKTQTKIYKLNYLAGDRGGKTDIHVSASGIPASTNNSTSNGTTTNTTTQQDSSRITTNSSKSSIWDEISETLSLILNSNNNPKIDSEKKFVINPQSGLVVVNGTPQELIQVDKYLSKLGSTISKQVMIEAKIIEVQLDKDNQNGINWAAFGNRNKNSLSIGNVQPGSTISPPGGVLDNGMLTAATSGALSLASKALGGIFGLALQTKNFSALLSFLESQGMTQVLSSPRIATLNNQKAILKVGNDEFYVTNITTSNVSNASSTTTTPSIMVQPFFSGIALDVTPQISDSGEIILHVHPSVSNVAEKQKNINLGSLGNFTLPLASSSINESDSVVKVTDGQIVAIGGLMKIDDYSHTNKPAIGEGKEGIKNALSSNEGAYSKKELVILLKPTVIDDPNEHSKVTESMTKEIGDLYEQK